MQQLDAASGAETAAEQEITVTVQRRYFQSAVTGSAQGGDDFSVKRFGAIIIADPGFKKIAEDK